MFGPFGLQDTEFTHAGININQDPQIPIYKTVASYPADYMYIQDYTTPGARSGVCPCEISQLVMA